MKRLRTHSSSDPRILQRVRQRALELRSLDDAELRDRAAMFRDTAGRLSRDTSGTARPAWCWKRLSATAAASLPKNRRTATSPELAEALALAVEGIRRCTGLTLHDCQILGAWFTASGHMIEMQTGEGKTLVCGAAAAVSALTGSRTHVATTNAYLADRDFQCLRGSFEILGLRSDVLPGGIVPAESRKAYQADIVYGPGYQFGFDYLADQLTRQKQGLSRLGRITMATLNDQDVRHDLIQPETLEATIIDEADSVLIDEALTPLILSGASTTPPDPEPYEAAHRFAMQLQEGVDFQRNARERQIRLTDTGLRKAGEFRRSVRSLRLQRPWKTYVENALRASLLMSRNEDYVVVDGKVKIVDPLTGRIFDDRSWQAGLHQAIETREAVPLTPPQNSQVRITRQAFIGRYEKLAGMSGTLTDTRYELQQTYGVDVVTIPTHRPCQRIMLRPRFFQSWEAKLAALARDVRDRHARGQPVLVGTTSVRKSLDVADALEQAGLKPTVLNGLQDQEEAEIVAQAGQVGQITIATNMAGRGTDIKPSAAAKDLGGLHVIGTEPNRCRRVDRQLIGRSGRQGDPGSAQFFISAADDLLLLRGPHVAQQIISGCDATGECHRDFASAIRDIQIQEENHQAFQRHQLVRNECWLNKVRETVFGE